MIEMWIYVLHRKFIFTTYLATGWLTFRQSFIQILHFLQIYTCITYKIILLINLNNSITTLMKTSITIITIDNFITGLIFSTKTYFTICLKKWSIYCKCPSTFFNLLLILFNILKCFLILLCCFIRISWTKVRYCFTCN